MFIVTLTTESYRYFYIGGLLFSEFTLLLYFMSYTFDDENMCLEFTEFQMPISFRQSKDFLSELHTVENCRDVARGSMMSSFVGIYGAFNKEVIDGKCFMIGLTGWLLLTREEIGIGKLGMANRRRMRISTKICCR